MTATTGPARTASLLAVALMISGLAALRDRTDAWPGTAGPAAPGSQPTSATPTDAPGSPVPTSTAPTASPGATPKPAAPSVGAAVAAAGWFQLDRRLDTRGASLGKTLTVGILGSSRVAGMVDLAEDSFALRPAGGTVLFGHDDGRTSRLQAMSTSDASIREVTSSDKRILAAATDASGGSVVYLTAPRAGGAVTAWRLLPDAGAPVEIHRGWQVPALGFGMFQVVSSIDGGAATAQFCGQNGCDAVWLDLTAGETTPVDGSSAGWIVGLAGRTIYSLEHVGETGRLLRHEVGGGTEAVADRVDWAQLETRGGRPVLVIERVDETELSFSVLDPVAAVERPLVRAGLEPAGILPFDLVGAGAERVAGVARLDGQVIVTAGGRLAGTARDTGRLLSLSDGAPVELREVVR